MSAGCHVTERMATRVDGSGQFAGAEAAGGVLRTWGLNFS